jgi:arylsulfatase A-like enzyme
MASDAHIPDYDAVRTRRYLYVKYATGEHELYDTKTDPEEIHNLAATGADQRVETLLDRQLEELRHCAGNSCRTAEARTLQQLATRAA